MPLVVRAGLPPLCANVSETLPPFEFRVYDEGGKERYHGEEGNDVG